MKYSTLITTIIFSGIVTLSNFSVLTVRAYASDQREVAMEFLRSSVRERDERLIKEIRKDEKMNQAKEEAAVDEFLAEDLINVDSLNIKARPMTKQSAVKASIVNYHKTGNVEPILVNSDLILFPYGLSQPVVACTPLRICHIELEEGEEIIDTSPGDTQRWWFGYTFVGEGERIKPHVLVKPLVEEEIETNLSISTNKRLYYIILKSVINKPYTKRIGFFYPQDYEEKASSLDNLKTKLMEYKNKDSFNPLDEVPVTALNFDYVFKGKKRTKFYPKRVFDDGKKVYIEMAKNIQSFELPVFMVIGKDKQYEAANYRYHNPYYIIDRMFDKGVLLLTPTSKKEEKVIIINNARE